jgi:transposase-like protein
MIYDDMISAFQLGFPQFRRRAIKGNGTPAKITIDKSGANKAAIDSHNSDHGYI